MTGKSPNESDDLEGDIERWTDQYFKKTRAIVQRNGDARVTYAVFMRRPVSYAPRLMIDWLHRVAAERGVSFEIESSFQEGDWAGAGEPLLYLSGPLSQLV
ncbi:MAG: nicotinate phosphoribosyltransferase, partial [Alphaproteobacteria bacterium]|nr:nicotinate phosphoribosyltransferase [Alphaproteobacteria bacterium]